MNMQARATGPGQGGGYPHHGQRSWSKETPALSFFLPPAGGCPVRSGGEGCLLAAVCRRSRIGSGATALLIFGMRCGRPWMR
jgi:hypothetical protein